MQTQIYDISNHDNSLSSNTCRCQIKLLTLRRFNMKHSKPAKAAAYTLFPHRIMYGGIPKLYTCSLGAAVRQTSRAIVCDALHSLVHLGIYIPTVAIAASNAVGHVIVALAAAACPVKAVLSVQLEGQDVGQSQAITVGWESLHKEQCALHSTVTAYHAGLQWVRSQLYVSRSGAEQWSADAQCMQDTGQTLDCMLYMLSLNELVVGTCKQNVTGQQRLLRLCPQLPGHTWRGLRMRCMVTKFSSMTVLCSLRRLHLILSSVLHTKTL